MYPLILGGIGFVPWVLYIIHIYYSKSFSTIDHIESAHGFGVFLLSIGIMYAIWKLYSLHVHKKEVVFNFWHITGFFLIQLILVVILYTNMIIPSPSFFANNPPKSITLLSNVLLFLIYPTFLVFLWRALGYSLLQYLPKWQSLPLRIRIGVEFSFGLGIFSFFLLGIGSLHAFNYINLTILLLVLSLLSFRGWKETYHDIKERTLVFPQHSSHEGVLGLVNPRLLSVEFVFILVSFVLATSLVLIIRPMPIGWDDLGVYMNIPRIIANTHALLDGVSMHTWQLITSTGFLWGDVAAQAFYVNQIGGIASIVVIISLLSIMFEVPNKKYIISLPVLLGVIYYIMPMTVFQQAKDMKLDPALMTVSVSAFGLLWYTLSKTKSTKGNIWYYVVVGFLIGLAFSIKFTTLMFIVATLGYVSYHFLGLSGFIGFFSLFLGAFTHFDFWSKMFVWMPKDPQFIDQIVLTCIIIGIVSIVGGVLFYGAKKSKQWALASLSIIAGILIALTPWFAKHINEGGISSNDSQMINTLLGGSGGTFSVNNYAAIYSPEQFKAKQQAQQSANITNDGKSLNEDFSRYFGQESGINNYLKLPVNMTFQKNQSGEFTDITFLFLALFPAMLLFVSSRYGAFAISIGISIVGYMYYVFSDNPHINTFFGNIDLPLGYAVFIGLMIGFVGLVHFLIDSKHEQNTHIKSVLIFMSIYGFLFLVSAFGIVWYGVFVYFLLLASIGLGALNFVAYDDTDKKHNQLFSVKVTLSVLFLIFILSYFIRSLFPHTWNNLLSPVRSGFAGEMNEYKYNRLDDYQSIFAYRGDYLPSIAALNLKDPQMLAKNAASLAKSAPIKKILTPEIISNITPMQLHQFLLQMMLHLQSNKIPVNQVHNIQQDIERIGKELYGGILTPDPQQENLTNIYRIGTFMTYLINKNRSRYFEDSLVFQFDTFFYDPVPEIAIDRMRKVGLGFLLVDLNAATIDRDPRRALTRRYEHLLATMRAKNLQLIDTDNTCLRVAIDEYHAGRITDKQQFLRLAGTNYESYHEKGMIHRNKKREYCANYIINMINNNTKTGRDIPHYIVSIKKRLSEAKTKEAKQYIIRNAAGKQTFFVLFEILDTPNVKKNVTPINPTGSGSNTP